MRKLSLLIIVLLVGGLFGYNYFQSNQGIVEAANGSSVCIDEATAGDTCGEGMVVIGACVNNDTADSCNMDGMQSVTITVYTCDASGGCVSNDTVTSQSCIVILTEEEISECNHEEYIKYICSMDEDGGFTMSVHPVEQPGYASDPQCSDFDLATVAPWFNCTLPTSVTPDFLGDACGGSRE